MYNIWLAIKHDKTRNLIFIYFIKLQETLHLLTTHFANERLKSATGELYSKYNVYIEPLVGLYAMISHALVVGTLQSYRGMLANKSMYTYVYKLIFVFLNLYIYNF